MNGNASGRARQSKRSRKRGWAGTEFELFGHLSLRIRSWFSAILRRELAKGAELRVKTPKMDVPRSGYYLS
jgi:hypothetical protein